MRGSKTRTTPLALAAALLAGTLTGCGDGTPTPATGSAPATPAVRTLVLGAYTTPREAYGKAVIPAFQRHWKERTGQDVKFQESYLGSGAQARAIVGGFEADVAALSLEADVESIARAGLITHDWKAGPAAGMVSRSIVVLAVRAGNPKGVRDWDDLRKSGLNVLTPNVRTSGGAMWNVCALHGAALRGHTAAPKGDAAAADALLTGVLRNVSVMDKGARESIVNFEKGVGDVAITYENEVLVGRQAGRDYEYVVPRSTILIENPVAVVDAYADRHGTRDVAEAFVAFVRSPEAQRAFAGYGYRPVDEAVAKETESRFPAVQDLFTVRDLGGWPAVEKTLFAPGAAYDRAAAAVGARP
jgi:sulfate transport system substrate-binding protein